MRREKSVWRILTVHYHVAFILFSPDANDGHGSRSAQQDLEARVSFVVLFKSFPENSHVCYFFHIFKRMGPKQVSATSNLLQDGLVGTEESE